MILANLEFTAILTEFGSQNVHCKIMDLVALA